MHVEPSQQLTIVYYETPRVNLLNQLLWLWTHIDFTKKNLQADKG